MRDDHRGKFIDAYLDFLVRTQGCALSAERRLAIHVRLADDPRFAELMGVDATQMPGERRQELEIAVLTAFVESPESDLVPTGITLELLAKTPEDELCSLLYDFLSAWLGEMGAHEPGRFHDAFRTLPRGLRMVWALTALESDVYNGGFVHFFDTSGNVAQETLEYCRLVGMPGKAALLERAIALKQRVGAAYEALPPHGSSERQARKLLIDNEFQAEWDGLDDAYYALDIEGPYELAARWVRRHPEECLANRKRG